MKPSFLRLSLLAIAIVTLASACTGKPNEAFATESTTQAVKETRAPGDFTLESIVNGAERHMEIAGFVDIPADKLEQLYPSITALPVEIRGRRAEDGTEYLVMASSNHRDFTLIPDVQKVLEGDAAKRANDLQLKYGVTAGGVNKYGAVAISKGDPNVLINTLLRTFTGEYIHN